MTAEYARRVAAVRAALRDVGVGALLVTPGADLRYLTGYHAVALERLTCLVVPAEGPVSLVVPLLEQPAALAAVGNSVVVRPWTETDDPYALVAALVPSASQIAVVSEMPAHALLPLQWALTDPVVQLAGPLIDPARMVKSAWEVAQLAAAAAAIDAAHAQVPELLLSGRTEREVAADVGAAIVAAGHASVDFVIVAAGENAASPHHEPGDRLIRVGDVVVVDIGGTMPSGYCSDCTRMYALASPPADFVDYYEVLVAAQAAGVAAVKPGVAAESVDAACREVIAAAGFGDYFVHRTGHGIGLATHEPPYLVAGNPLPLAPGMVFSVEPGIYLPGRHGARIEDIVAVTASGCQVLNDRPRELVVV